MKELHIQELEMPEGWLGDPNEWPILFFRNHVSRYHLGSQSFEYEPHPHTVICYVSLEDTGGYDLQWTLLSALPDLGRRDRRMTWLEWEIQYNDDSPVFWEQVREALGGEQVWWESRGPNSETANADWLMSQGLCPDQWFILKLTPHYVTHPATVNGPEEYDFEVSAELLDAEKVTPEEHLERWSDFLFEVTMNDGLPRAREILDLLDPLRQFDDDL